MYLLLQSDEWECREKSKKLEKNTSFSILDTILKINYKNMENIIQFFFKHLDLVTAVIWVCWFLFWIFQYKRSIDLKRAEWISKLYDTFYITEHFSYCKSNIIYSKTLNKEITTALINSFNWEAQDEKSKLVIEKVDNFLNFFEFIIYLNEIKQINSKDLNAMFSRFLKKIKSHDLLYKVIEKNWYKRLYKYFQRKD